MTSTSYRSQCVQQTNEWTKTNNNEIQTKQIKKLNKIMYNTFPFGVVVIIFSISFSVTLRYCFFLFSLLCVTLCCATAQWFQFVSIHLIRTKQMNKYIFSFKYRKLYSKIAFFVVRSVFFFSFCFPFPAEKCWKFSAKLFFSALKCN